MNVIGLSGLATSVAFKQKWFPGLSKREYRIAQGFDSAAALVGPQGIIAAAAEERFTREKATGAFPVQAIRYCLQAANLHPRDVDLIAHGFSYEPWKTQFQADEYGRRQYEEVYSPEVQRAFLRAHFGDANWSERFVAVPHHLAHAASTFYPSGFKEALIVVSDGMGETQSLTVALGAGPDIKIVAEVPAFHSLGALYGVFTLYLGFYMGLDEYKVMGLAPYGNPRRFFDRMMQFVSLKNDGTYTLPIFARNFTPAERETHAGVLRFLEEQFGPPREPETEITQFHKDIAAGLQALLETCQLHVLQHYQRETGQRNLCLAGGVALNCAANGVIRRRRLFERMFVQPASGDDGCALGAALYAQRLHDSAFVARPMSLPLWGPESTDDEIRQSIAGRTDCSVKETCSFGELCADVAKRIAQGQIVAWFQGRMEFGPRALGSRSILADPRDPAMRDKINALVKKREGFRPFAPVVTQEAASRIFEIPPGEEPAYAHMLYVTRVRPEFRDKLPATTHVDGSARVQTVAREQNPRLWQLLVEFEKLSGLPVLLNTSFNVRGQPIVCTPQEAVETFLAANLHVLVAGDLVVLPRSKDTAAPKSEGRNPPPSRRSGAMARREGGKAEGSPKPEFRKRPEPRGNNANAFPVPLACLHEFFEAQARNTPEATAVVFENERLTYRELDRRANQLAHYLRKQKVGPEVLVGICLEPSLELMVGLLGVLKAGGAYVPLDPDYPPERLAHMIRDAHLQVLLTQQRLMAFIPETLTPVEEGGVESADGANPDFGATVICLDAQWDNIAAESTQTLPSGAGPENLAYVIYTSGSTGKPKGVMVEHRNVANFFAAMDSRIGAEPPGVWLAVTSISFDISVLELFWTLARGFKVVLLRKEARAGRARTLLPSTIKRPLDFSLFYFASDESAADTGKYNLLLDGARFADEHGFAAVWTPERHFHAFGGLYPNPSVTSAAIAATTRRVQIRAGSIVLPLHNPIRVAEEWAVVDNLSNGRAGLSFASGWQANDFVLAPQNYDRRREIMVSQIELLRRLWRGETVSFPGAKGRDVPVKILPRPVQPELPLWITASGSPTTFQLAGELGANLLTHLLGQSLAELTEKIAAYRAAWKEKGHAGQGQVALMLHTFVGDDLAAVRERVRKPLIAYLRSSIDLLKNDPLAFTPSKRPARNGGGGANGGPANFTEEDLDVMSEHAFDRYFETSGLFGTPQSCGQILEKLESVGVDEIACLIDFGIEAGTVLAGLEQLNELRLRISRQSRPSTEDYSLPAEVARHGVTHMQCTPSLAALLAEDARALGALRSLKVLLLGGEALPAALVRKLDFPGALLNMYGPTETTIWSTTHTVEKDSGTVLIGRPIANTEIYIVDENLQRTVAGAAGELLIGGAGVVRGYLNRPELTAERFIPNPYGEGRLYRTGDLARYLADGNIEFLGRIDQQVKLRGFRIELGEIESILGEHPAVKECAAIVREDAPGDKRLVAYIVPIAGQSFAADPLRELARRKLPDYMVPSTFVPLAAFPLTPNGKLDRKSLPRPEAVVGSGSVFASPAFLASPPPFSSSSAVGLPAPVAEEAIAEIWRGVLGVEQARPQDNFFELGGNSILATQLVSRLRQALKWEVPLRLAFEFPTIEGLTRSLQASRQAGAPLPAHQMISRRKNSGEFPMSFAQRRLWFLDQLEPGPHYNDHFGLRLAGTLDAAILEKALNEIIRRHEALRSVFSAGEGRPVQAVLPALRLNLRIMDLSERSPADREREAEALAVQQARTLFDLKSGPLMRGSLLRLAPDEHVLVLTFHHLVMDGWSRGAFLRELTALYEAFLAGRASPLPELPIQYADFAAWQQRWLDEGGSESGLAYWKEQLRDAPALLELPTDRPRPAMQTYRGARHSISLDKALIDKLTALAHQEGCTLFMVLVAAFQALLARYSGREDVVIGTPVANRNHAETERLIGYFLNVLVLRGDLSGDPQFVDLLGRARRMALAAYAHQDLPFEKLVAELQPARHLGYSPVFQVLFILQNAPKAGDGFGGLTWQPFEIDTGISKFDLTLNLEETAEGCAGWIEYATDLFDADRIVRFADDFRALLEGVAARPNARLSHLPLLGAPGPELRAASRFSRISENGARGQGEEGNGFRTRTPSPRSSSRSGEVDEPEAVRSLAGHVANGGGNALPSDLDLAPRTPVEKDLARIWAEVLGAKDIGLHDSLFDLGGHSLLITMIMSRIQKVFGVEVPIQAFFDTPTVGDIAAIIEAQLKGCVMREPTQIV